MENEKQNENEIDLNLRANEEAENIMEDIQVVLKFMKHVVAGFVWMGLVLVIGGLLIFIFPRLLEILVAAFLIATGIVCFIWAKKINKFTSFKIKL